MNKFFGFFATVLALWLWSSDGRVHAQVKKPAGPIKGTVISIEKARDGRSYTLKMKADDDTEYDVPLAPRTQVKVAIKTDHEIVKAGMIVEDSKLVDSGGELISSHLTLLVGGPFSPQLQQVQVQAKDDDIFHMVGQVRKIMSQPECQD